MSRDDDASLRLRSRTIGPAGGTARLLHVAVIGRIRAWAESGEDVLPASRKAQALLAYLALSPGRPVRRSRIAGLLWDRVPEDQARNSLRQALVDLRAALAPCGDSPIEAGREELLLRADRCRTDLATLEASLQEKADPVMMGAPLEDLDGISPSFDQVLAEERARIEERLRCGLEGRVEALCRDGAAAEARIAAARNLLSLDPTHERAWRLVIGTLAELGDVGQALREYARCEEALGRLLDVAPSPETKALRQRIKAATRPTPAAVPPSLPERLPPGPAERQASIAVLPFTTMPEGPGVDFLANGLAEGIIHVLSGIGDLFVIARGSVMAYAGRIADPRLVRHELGVRYLLQGSVTCADNQMRIFVELIETATGRVIRTDRHDAAPADLFALQDTVAAAVVSTIAPTVRLHDLAEARRKPPGNLTAYDMLLSGLDLMYGLERPGFETAGAVLQAAMRVDPGFAAVRSHAATWHNFRIAQGWSPDPAGDSAAAARLSAEALEIDHNDAIALAIQGQVLSFTKRDYVGARQFLDRAVAMGPSCPMAWALSSTTLGWVGEGGRAVEHARRALDLSPLDPFAFFAEHMVSQGHYVAGEHEAAVEWGQRAAARNGRLTSNLRTLTAALVASGRRDAARTVAARILELEPSFSLCRFAARTPFCTELRDLHVARLRQAGLPD